MPSYTLPRRSREAEPVVVELEPVPTIRELAERKGAPVYATVVSRTTKGEPNVWMLTQAGHALLGEIMRRNGQRLAEAEAQRPPIKTDPDLTPAQKAAKWAREAFADDAP